MDIVAESVYGVSPHVPSCRAMWQKPGMTQQDWITDRYLCERDMRQSGYQDKGLAQIIDGRAFFNRCLEARGYRQQAQ